jgi:CheY-like chemotaxis protein
MNTQAKILIVDDEEVVRLSYMRTLAETNCKVKAVWSWTQVSQAMQQDPFDVVLLDLRMPEMDGMAILKALKQRWPESEVIIITGYPTLESAKEAVTLPTRSSRLPTLPGSTNAGPCITSPIPGSKSTGNKVRLKFRLGCRTNPIL